MYKERSGFWKLRPWTRHSLVLLIVGLGHIGIGILFWNTDLSKVPESQLVNLTLALRWLDFKQWGFIFALTGMLTILSSRWPWKPPLWGYVLLTYLSAIWGGFYFASVIVYRSTVNNMAGGVTWAIFAFLWWGISGLVDPVRREESHGD